VTAVRTLIPLNHPAAWAEAAARGPGAVAVVPRVDPLTHAGVRRLALAGGRPLGRVGLEFATRAPTEVLDEIARWAALAVQGIFFDQCPSGPYQVGPVVQAVRAARRAGLGTVVLNPGVPVDPIYRNLDATLCTFEGTWLEYLRRSGQLFVPGDGHLVLDVPAEEQPYARAMTLARGAGLFLVTERTELFATDPAGTMVTQG
jgi:hypothetical protein